MRLTLSSDCGDGLIDDDALLPHLNAANIACGALAISDDAIRHCVRLCARSGVDAGAGPSVMDRAHLGMRVGVMTPESIAAVITRQLALMQRICTDEDVPLRHVRLHGALNLFAATDPDVAGAVAECVAAHAAETGADIVLAGPAESHLISAGRRNGVRVAGEVFADRVYEPDGSLRGRSLPGALIDDFARCLDQALSLAQAGFVRAHDGSRLYLDAQTICIEPHAPRAVARAQYLRRELQRAGVDCLGYSTLRS
jgi:5-oxoprolinase (ATP-hydrolysing) subunit A